MPNQASGTSRSRLSDHSAASTEWTTHQSTAASRKTESQPSRGPYHVEEEAVAEDIAKLLGRRGGPRGRGRRASGMMKQGKQCANRRAGRHHTATPRAPTIGEARAR